MCVLGHGPSRVVVAPPGKLTRRDTLMHKKKMGGGMRLVLNLVTEKEVRKQDSQGYLFSGNLKK